MTDIRHFFFDIQKFRLEPMYVISLLLNIVVVIPQITLQMFVKHAREKRLSASAAPRTASDRRDARVAVEPGSTAPEAEHRETLKSLHKYIVCFWNGGERARLDSARVIGP